MRRPAADGWRLQSFAELPSTSDLCRSLALAGEPDGLAVMAGRQTRGRGSRGRDWQTPVGNLALSVLIRPREHARSAGQWALLAAVALADALEPFVPAGRQLRVKWPNDLLLDGAKLAGILLDSATDADGAIDWMVIGMGANLAAPPDVPGRVVATLGTQGAPSAVSPNVLAPRVLEQLTVWRRIRLLDGFAPIRAAWLARGPEAHASMMLQLAGHTVTGSFEGLGDDGSLLLKSAGRVHAFTAGEVMLPARAQR